MWIRFAVSPAEQYDCPVGTAIHHEHKAFHLQVLARTAYCAERNKVPESVPSLILSGKQVGAGWCLNNVAPIPGGGAPVTHHRRDGATLETLDQPARFIPDSHSG